MQLKPELNLNQIRNSKVLVRVGFDLPNLQDLSRIESAKATILQLHQQNNQIFLVTKWGDRHDISEQKEFKKKFATKKLLESVKKVLGLDVEFLNQFDLVGAWENLNVNSQIILLENAYCNQDEWATSVDDRLAMSLLASKYAALVDYFVDECFISSHRNEVTNTEIKDFLPWCYGLNYLQEIQNLNKIKNNPQKPFVLIVGGGKLTTKIPLILKRLPNADKVLIAGMPCFTFLEARKALGLSLVNDIYHYDESQVDWKLLDQVKEVLTNYNHKIVLPIDAVYPSDPKTNRQLALDIGKKTLELFQHELQGAKTIFWNGPIGQIENKQFENGTNQLAKIITELEGCFCVVGGGDTVASLKGSVNLKKFDWISMGGGASLSYLSK
jgi:phosphoglycerate kinase